MAMNSPDNNSNMSQATPDEEREANHLEDIHFERSFARILENLTMASVMRNSSGKIAFINSHFLQISGYERGEVMGRDFVEVFVPSEAKMKAKNTYELIAAGLVMVNSYEEEEIIKKDGSTILIGWNNTLMKDNDGNFIGISSIGEVVLEKKAATDSKEQQTDENDIALQNYEKTEQSASTMIDNVVLIKVLKSLGGEKGHVQLAVHKTTKQLVAVKSLRKDTMKPEEVDRARREIDIMKQLNRDKNPYIIKLLDAEETDNHFNLVIEYVSGGELVSLILESQGLKEFHSQKLFKQLVCAIKCCHDNSIVHRDIKLQNILLDDQGNIKLIDFGLSNFFEVGRFRSTFCGTPAYAPPEILLGTLYKGPEVDIWSLGVVLYSMITSNFPFTTIAEILKGRFKVPENISDECLDLIKRMLDIKKESRITLPEVMAHPWLNKELCQNVQDITSPKRKDGEGLIETSTKRHKAISTPSTITSCN